MKIKRLCLIPALLITMILVVTASRAANSPPGGGTAKHSLPAKADTAGPVLANIPTDPTTELIRLHQEWDPIRFAELSHRAKDRWIQAMFQGDLPAERTLNRTLEIENLALREKVARLQTEKTILYQHTKQLEERLRMEESDYEDLKTKSAAYLKWDEEYRSVKSALATARENTRSLALENENLKISYQTRRIVIGIVMLCVGWLAGMLMGRYRRKRRSSYFVK